MNFLQIFAKFRSPLLVTWVLILSEKLLWVVEPAFFGKLIDAVILHGHKISLKTEHFFIFPLALWAGVYICNTSLGFIRRVFSQKLHLRILSEVTEENFKRALTANVDDSVLLAKTQNTREYVSFLQNKIPDVFEVFVSVGGSVVALMLFDVRIGLTCMFLIIPIIFLEKISGPRLLLTQKEFHDRNQRLYAIVSARDPKRLRAHLDDLSSPQIASNRWSAFNFVVLRSSLLVIFLVVLVISFDIDHFSTGTIYSIVSYLWTAIAGIELLPELRETLSSAQDLEKRLR